MAMGSFMTPPTLLVQTGPAMDSTTLLTWKQVTALSTFSRGILLYEDHAPRAITEVKLLSSSRGVLVKKK